MRNFHRLSVATAVYALLLWPATIWANGKPTSQFHPNILLIVADDMGYADLGAYGSEIPTPNLDKLAKTGMRFTQFRASPACSPSRAMLLTGVDAHAAGLGNMQEELAPNQVGQPGYEGHLNERVTTIGEYLQDVGYRTLLSGKWHLGETPTSLPSARGFDRTFALASGGASHFADMRPAYAKSPTAKAKYFSNGTKLDSLPAEFNYSSQFYVDWLMSELSEENTSPFFAMLSFTAPHWPLQAPEEAMAKFAGNYDKGYDKALKARFKKQKSLGVISRRSKLNKTPWKPWKSLSDSERANSAKAMETYAAMIHEMDRHTGRLIEYLRSTQQLDNTLIIFLSDNGAEGHTYNETWPEDLFPQIRANIDDRHDFSYKNIGHPGSYTFYNAEWARVGAPSSRLHKGFSTEGGLRVPAFINLAGRIPAKIEHSPVFIKDIVPTLLDLLNIKTNPQPNKAQVSGISFAPLFRGVQGPSAPRVEITELFGKVAVVDYPWKAIRLPAPWKQEGVDDWTLYNLELDNLEAKNLAMKHPDKLKKLLAAWARYKKRHRVILPDWVSGY